MKIEGYGQAKILTQEEIERLFSTGLETSRDRTLLGVCLYTACTAEACSLMVKDIYTNSGIVRSTINFAKANTKGKLQTRTIRVIEDLRSLADIKAFPRRLYLFIPRPSPEPPLEAFAPRLSGQGFEKSVQADRHRGRLHPQLPSHRPFASDEQRGYPIADYSRNQRSQ